MLVRALPSHCALAFGLAVAALTSAQDSPGEFTLPADPTQWINSGPISAQALKGKAALLWFFEEDCPKCRAKWPGMMALSKKYEGQPIAFIAVNSGNLRGPVEQYLRSVRVTWPTIVDPTRQFEAACDVGEISLQNIHQAKVLTPEGRLTNGNWDDLEGTVESALRGARWNVDPTSIPAPLKTAWSAVEFGDFASGAAQIKKGLNSNKTEIKRGAELLNDYVKGRIEASLGEAEVHQAQGDNWQTFRAFQKIADQFAGYELPSQVTTQLKELSSDEEVKKQLALMKQLAQAKKSLTSVNRSARAGAVNKLKKLVSDAPDSDAAKEAAELLKQAGN